MTLFADLPPAVSEDKQQLRRAAAELDAARARLERDKARAIDDARTELITELLPVLDNVDRSIAAGADAAPAVEGMRLVRAQLAGVLRGYGLERFDATGERFDPRRHEAVAVVETRDPAHDGVVVEQWQPGYARGERLIRPARVAVGRLR